MLNAAVAVLNLKKVGNADVYRDRHIDLSLMFVIDSCN